MQVLLEYLYTLGSSHAFVVHLYYVVSLARHTATAIKLIIQHIHLTLIKANKK